MDDPRLRRSLFQDLLPSVHRNCVISNAQQSGLFSVCGLFLRLKDRYLWENQLPPWHPTDREKLLSWIDAQETLWLRDQETPFQPLRFNGRSFHYLDHPAVNRWLVPMGFYYGSGFGRGMKPTFFLGPIRETKRVLGYRVFVLEKDLACDLALTPAQRQGRTIVLRLDPLRFFLWSLIQEPEVLEREGAQMALKAYGWSPSRSPQDLLEKMVADEAETILYHELGEALDRTIPRRVWKSLLSFFPFSRIELYLRTLKDLLADTHPHGTLDHIIAHKKTGSLGFYLSNLRGLRGLLCPEILSAIRCFRVTGDWQDLERTRKRLRRRLLRQGGLIRELYERHLPENPDDFAARFEEAFFLPLAC